MSALDTVVQIEQGLQEELAALNERLMIVNALKGQILDEKASEYTRGWDEAMKVAALPPETATHTEADVEATLQPLRDQIAALQVSLDGVSAEKDAAVAESKSASEAMEAVKAEFQSYKDANLAQAQS